MPLSDKLKKLLSSRRFWAAIGGVAVNLLHEQLGLDPDTAQNIVNVVIAWIIGDSITKTM